MAEKASFGWGTLFLVLGQVSDVTIPMFIGFVIDLLRQKRFDEVGKYALIQFGIVIVAGIMVGLRAIVFNILSERVSRKLRYDFYSKVMREDIGFYDKNQTGKIMSIMNSDIQVIQDGVGSNFSMQVRAVVTIAVVLVIMVWLSPILTGVTFAGVMVILLVTKFFMGQMTKAQRKIQEAKGQISQVSLESFQNIRTVKAFAAEGTEIAAYGRANSTVFYKGLQKQLLNSFFASLVQLLMYGSMALVILTATWLVQNEMITVGNIVSFLFYFQIMNWNFMMISYVLNNLATMIGGAYKVYEIMNHQPAINTEGGNTLQPQATTTLEVRDVKFRYPTKPDVQILKGVSFTVSSDNPKVVALCGTSGCGKSSIISLVERFYDPEEGQVLYNGHDIRELDPRWYHQQVAIVQQEPILFSGTIRENILYGLDELVAEKSKEEQDAMMDVAARGANAYDFLHDPDAFPLVYDTLVGERGIKLSGGQKQRIAIARALIRKPKLLLLDEATSALDAESEHQVQKALDELIARGEQTVIVIAHRLSTIRDADEIIVMKHGEVMERGNHDSLLKLNGVYKALVSRQLVAEELEKDEKAPDAAALGETKGSMPDLPAKN